MIIDQLASVIRFAIEDLDAVQVETDHEEIIKDDLVIKNEIYKCEGLRKLHLEIAKTNNLDVLHCVFFPDFEYPIPIFGADIIATRNTVTAAIVDVSPVHNTGNIYYSIAPLANSYHFTHKRALPLWGEIFSPFCKFQRLHLQNEQQDFIHLVNNILLIYCDWVKRSKKDDKWVNNMLRLDDQIWYCKSQKQNKKTLAVLTQWFGKEFAENYIDKMLFDTPKLK